MSDAEETALQQALTKWRPVFGEARFYFLNKLREARLAAQKDAEQFDQLLFVFERLGCYRLGEARTLRQYRDPLLDLASHSALGRSVLADAQRISHSRTDTLYRLVTDARNDAMHPGARARHITRYAIELGLILEDALMNGYEPMELVSDFMVREVTMAQAWWPISFVRETMLTNSFSYLPWYWQDEWRLISASAVARFLRHGDSYNHKRSCLMAKTLVEARRNGEEHEKSCGDEPKLWITPAQFVHAGANVNHIVKRFKDSDILLVMKDETAAKTGPRSSTDLVGIVTAYDIL